MNKHLTVVMLALVMAACATVPPPPPRCEGNSEDLRPINPAMMTPAQINAVREAARQEAQQRLVDTRGGQTQ